jgi:hypothetical protein
MPSIRGADLRGFPGGVIGEGTDAAAGGSWNAVSMRSGTDMTTSEDPAGASFGLSEQRLRESLEEELVRYMRTAGNAPTIHAIAAAIARVLEEDHLAMAEQLTGAGVRFEEVEPGK